jgi:hypothetical protein
MKNIGRFADNESEQHDEEDDPACRQAGNPENTFTGSFIPYKAWIQDDNRIEEEENLLFFRRLF